MAHFENRLSQSFFTADKKDYRLKLIYHNQRPMVGISVFYQNGVHRSTQEPIWMPGKKHFFMPLEAWQQMSKIVPDFANEVEKGAH